MTVAILTNDSILRVRPLGSDDDWCICQVAVMSTSGNSLGLLVQDGALRIRSGLMRGAVMVSIEDGHAFETISNTELEIEMKR
jgi:hypothetical protein